METTNLTVDTRFTAPGFPQDEEEGHGCTLAACSASAPPPPFSPGSWAWARQGAETNPSSCGPQNRSGLRFHALVPHRTSITESVTANPTIQRVVGCRGAAVGRRSTPAYGKERSVSRSICECQALRCQSVRDWPRRHCCDAFRRRLTTHRKDAYTLNFLLHLTASGSATLTGPGQECGLSCGNGLPHACSTSSLSSPFPPVHAQQLSTCKRGGGDRGYLGMTEVTWG